MRPFSYSDYESQLMDSEYIRMLQRPRVRFFRDCRRVLDLACGPGIFLELLKEAGIEAEGVDRDEKIVEKARLKNLKVVHADVFDYLQTGKEGYDGVFCSHLLEHLPFDQVVRLVDLITGRLDPQGVLALVLPNPGSIRLHLFGFWRDPEHIRFYTGNLIASVCKHYGLEVEYSNEEETPNLLDPPRFESLSMPPSGRGQKGFFGGKKDKMEGFLQEFNQKAERFNLKMENFRRPLTRSGQGMMKWSLWQKRETGRGQCEERSCFLHFFGIRDLGGVAFPQQLFLSGRFRFTLYQSVCWKSYLFFYSGSFPGSFYYRPLSMLLWWLSYEFFGLNSTLHNLLNLSLHTINTFLVYLLLRELFPQRGWMTLISSILFLFHPLSVSTSLWLSDRFDLLATMFILSAIYFFVKFRSSLEKKYFIFSIFSTFLGILSKEMAYILPLLITLILLTYPSLKSNDRWDKKVILLAPYYLMTLSMCAIRFLLLRGTEVYYYQGGVLRSLWNGFSNWVHFMPEIYAYHFGLWGVGDFLKYFFILWFLLLLIILLLSIRKREPIPWYLFFFGLGISRFQDFLSRQ